jgi:hypothetical protein
MIPEKHVPGLDPGIKRFSDKIMRKNVGHENAL